MNTGGVAKFIAALRLEEMPPEVVALAKLCVMDTLGVLLCGGDTRAARIARGMVESRGGKEESTLFGSGARVPAPQAAFANCVAASALDFDDGHSFGCHPGSVVVPAALAVAEARGASGVDLLEGVVAGYEVGMRAIENLVEKGAKGERPFPATGYPSYYTGTGGAYCAAAAAAKVLGCDRDQTAHALGIAAAHAPSTRPFTIQSTGHMVKEVIGWGGMTGVEAAYLAQHGFTGPNTIFDDERSRGTGADTLGSAYQILNGYFKPYPACRNIHTALDATLTLMKRHSLSADRVSRVRIVAREAYNTLNSARPVSIEQAQYSFPFVIGAALAYGHHGPDTMNEEKLTDPAILKQADKVVLEPDPSLMPRDYSTVVTIETVEGEAYRLQRLRPGRGSTEAEVEDELKPMTGEELTSKFLSLASPLLGEDNARRTLEAIHHLDGGCDVGELVELLRRSIQQPVAG